MSVTHVQQSLSVRSSPDILMFFPPLLRGLFTLLSIGLGTYWKYPRQHHFPELFLIVLNPHIGNSACCRLTVLFILARSSYPYCHHSGRMPAGLASSAQDLNYDSLRDIDLFGNHLILNYSGSPPLKKDPIAIQK